MAQFCSDVKCLRGFFFIIIYPSSQTFSLTLTISLSSLLATVAKTKFSNLSFDKQRSDPKMSLLLFSHCTPRNRETSNLTLYAIPFDVNTGLSILTLS